MSDFGHNADNDSSNDSPHEKHLHGNSPSIPDQFACNRHQVVDRRSEPGSELRQTVLLLLGDRDPRWRFDTQDLILDLQVADLPS